MGCSSSTQKTSKGEDGHNRATNQNSNLNEGQSEHREIERRPQSRNDDDTRIVRDDGGGDANTYEDNDDNEYYGFDGPQANPPPKPSPPPAYESREQTPPREPTPPPREATPPSREPTPPPREPTPPPREPTPPPREPTPPPRETTPLPEARFPTPEPYPEHFENDDEDDTPFDDDGVRDAEGYSSNAMGLLEKTTDFRLEHAKDDVETRPYGDPHSLFVDHEFPLEIAIVQDNHDIEWKRPKVRFFLPCSKLFCINIVSYYLSKKSATVYTKNLRKIILHLNWINNISVW